jgi:hypothetical protein
MTTRALTWALAALMAGGAAMEASAQNGGGHHPVADYPGAAPVPFGPGEALEYQVKLGMFSVGSGHLDVLSIDSVRGNPTYHVRMNLGGGIPLARVNDSFESWIDIRNLVSRRFIKDQSEAGYKKFQHFELYPEERRFERADVDEEGTLPTSLPLDDISFIYFARSLPLEVGKEYTFHRYFEEAGNPVVLRVLRKDVREVPAGTFNTIVVQPIIRSSGLWSEGGEAEIHFSDDDQRYVVYMKADVPNFPGSLTLHLRNVQAADPIRPPRWAGTR